LRLTITGEGPDFALIFFCQVETSQLIVCLDHMVSLNYGGEDREAVFVVQLGIVAIAVDAGDLNLST
jgi:hypothetical protein